MIDRYVIYITRFAPVDYNLILCQDVTVRFLPLRGASAYLTVGFPLHVMYSPWSLYTQYNIWFLFSIPEEGLKLAMKTITVKRKDSRELSILKQIYHDNIVKLR